jgi:hypothetical protein
MSSTVVISSDMKACCADPANRREGLGPRGDIGGWQERDDVTVTHCVICSCRHMEAVAEAGEFGVVGVGI